MIEIPGITTFISIDYPFLTDLEEHSMGMSILVGGNTNFIRFLLGDDRTCIFQDPNVLANGPCCKNTTSVDF
jgi:hypothetical protein